MTISAIGQDAGMFLGTLSVEDVEDPNGETNGLTAAKTESGDVVSISVEARELASSRISEDIAETSGDSNEEDTLIKQLQEMIAALEQEIQQLKQQGGDGEAIKLAVQEKENELMELRQQLMDLQTKKMEAAGYTVSGGTRAAGFGNSTGTF